MTVRQLIRILRHEDLTAEVILASGEEGNQYQPLVQIDRGAFRQEDDFYDSKWGLYKLTSELEKQGYTQEDVLEDGKKAIALYP